jgi:nucleotide-binding universal stress UspA family protein
MKLLDKILLPIDFSDAAENALNAGVQLAKRFDSEIILFHSIDGFEACAPRHLESAVVNEMRHIQGRLNDRGIRTREPIVARGRVYDQIVEYADRSDVNLIVMGTRSQIADESHWIGTYTAEVMRKSKQPVWSIKPESPLSIARILCAVDFSAPSSRALDNAVHLARDLAAELIALHVVEPLPGSRMYRIAPRKEDQKKHLRESEAAFDKLLGEFDFSDVRYRREVREGDPSDLILRVADETTCDLLITGSAGRTRLTHLLSGSIAEIAMRRLSCSVVTIKNKDLIRPELGSLTGGLENRYREGCNLLAEGFAEEAIHRLELCVEDDMMFAAGWDALAEAHIHLGNTDQFRRCKEQADLVRQAGDGRDKCVSDPH